MTVHLERLDDAYHLRGTNAEGNAIEFDLTESEGGTGSGVGPMQAVAMSLAGCSAVDIVGILKKARQNVTAMRMAVDYDRADTTPGVFTRLHVRFEFEGEVEMHRVERAVTLSLSKYCSVARMLASTARLEASWSVNGQLSETVQIEQG
jgi:putative redox protein